MSDQPKPETHWERPDNWHPEGPDAVKEINAALEAKQAELNLMTQDAINLKKQLAAERDKNWRNAYDNLLIDYQQLREQLAAAQDALNGMLDVYAELHAKYDLGDCQATVDARAELAKVKEGK